RLLESRGGLVAWMNLRWYPLLLVMYHAGVAALEGKNYKSLASIFYTKLGSSDYDSSDPFFALRVANAAGDLVDVFKRIPDHERNYTPISEYLYKLIQPELDDMLFLGKGYEGLFDEFEILFALVVADLKKQQDKYV